MPGGPKDSTRTRVVPVFNELLRRNGAETEWINKLLSLASDTTASLDRPKLGVLHEHRWGELEKKLAPPLPLLEWLLVNADVTPLGDNFKRDDTTELRRKLLIEKCETTKSKAKSFLHQNSSHQKQWYCFEGESQPDVYLETDNTIIVIEGKRTEASITVGTKWMRCRHQMIRHLDCVYDIKNGKRVFGIFIVEGDGGADSTAVPERWRAAANSTKNDANVFNSLPHRNPKERSEIVSSYLGITTWQIVCDAFKIPWTSLPDTIDTKHNLEMDSLE